MVFTLKKAWHYYVFTLAFITFLFMIRNTDPRVVGVAGLYGLNSATLILTVALSSITAFVMGMKNIRSKWLYPVLVSLYAYLVLPLVVFLTYFQADSPFYFMYYVALGFFYVFLVQVTVTLIGLLLGVMIRKKRTRKERSTS